MGKVKKSSYKKKWGGEGEGVEAPAPAAPAANAANAEPAPNPTEPSIFENLNPSAAVAGVTGALSSFGTAVQGKAQGLESKLVNVDAGLKEKVGELTKQFEGKFEAVTNVVTGEATGAAPAVDKPAGGGKRRRTRKRTAKRKSHKRKKTHKRKKSHKRRK